MTTKPTNLSALAKAATAADDAARAARAKLADAEAANYAEANKRRDDAEAAWFASYDEAADRAACTQAAEALADAIRNTELGRALVDYSKANQDAARRWRRAADYSAMHGGPRDPGTFKYVLIDGRTGYDRLDFAQYLNGVLGAFAYRIGEEEAEANAEQIDADFQAAYDSAAPAAPVAWRVTLHDKQDAVHELGGKQIMFSKGVAYVEEALARWWERKGFQVAPVHEIPEDWTGSVTAKPTITETVGIDVTVRPASGKTESGMGRYVL